MKRFFLCLLFLAPLLNEIYAIGYYDPIRAGLFVKYGNQQKKALKAQSALILSRGGSHEAYKIQVNKATKFYNEYYAYLDSLHDVLQIGMECFGMYCEIKSTIKHVKQLQQSIRDNPDHLIAVALMENRNLIYANVTTAATNIVADIRTLFLAKTKMTEKERIEILYQLRPKIRILNKQLTTLTMFVKYTNMSLVINQITGRITSPKSKKEIAEKCKKDWIANLKY